MEKKGIKEIQKALGQTERLNEDTIMQKLSAFYILLEKCSGEWISRVKS